MGSAITKATNDAKSPRFDIDIIDISHFGMMVKMYVQSTGRQNLQLSRPIPKRRATVHWPMTESAIITPLKLKT